ncbi:MAG: site-2 protease family protein [Hyphomicrobiales bacterium]|nr:site-2 protease family protein [Hyphomicrobiales bacterium]MBV8824779.1 site-2 protease family protein [Hyphomicrobiales bacterium]MBV9428682.1 site-2 protease family protein [Bradyrhizobiaceae bacterium]
MTFIFVVVGWIFSLCLHEFAHAAVAFLGGDTSVREKGYLTFNPLRYVDPIASLFVPLVFLLLGGIGLPGGAVYIDARRLRSRWWACAVALAGPAANLAIAGVLVLALSTGVMARSAAAPPLAFLALLQVMAVILNLLPLPPLDGYRAIAPFLPKNLQMTFDRWGSLPLFILLLLWVVPTVSSWFWIATFRLAGALGVPLALAGLGLKQFRIFW